MEDKDNVRDLEFELTFCLQRRHLAAFENAQVKFCRERVFVCCMHGQAVGSR